MMQETIKGVVISLSSQYRFTLRVNIRICFPDEFLVIRNDNFKKRGSPIRKL